MINKPPPFKGLIIKIPMMIPVKGRGFINHGFGLSMAILTVTQEPLLLETPTSATVNIPQIIDGHRVLY